MNLEELPIATFVDPHGHNRQQVESLAHQVLTLVLDHLTQAADRPPLPELSAVQPTVTFPEAAVPEADILEQVQALMQSSMNAAHPGYIGHMDSMPTTFSMLGDLVTAALNNNLLSVEMSPALSRLESRLLREMADRFGLGSEAGGVLASGGTLANLQAIAVARNVAFQSLKDGLVGLPHSPVLLASDVAHTSLQKAAMLLGLGTSAVVKVKTNLDSQMDVEDLVGQIQLARANGKAPFCVVATAGTTTTGNIDPIPAIAKIARAYGLWLHVDAAYGGALMFSETHCDRLRGIEQADSITFNPQKWLYVAKTCAMVLFRDMGHLDHAFRVQAPYMQESSDLVNLGEIGVQGTRHGDVLKLWLSLQHVGRRGYAQLIDESDRLTQEFLTELQRRPFLQLASQPQMNLICFRGIPDWIASETWNAWNTDLQSYLLQTGHTFLSLPTYRGDRWLRAVLLNPYTETHHIQHLFQHIDAFAGR